MRDQELQTAFLVGQPGLSGPLDVLAATPVVRLSVAAWAAAPWTVSLLAMQSPLGRADGLQQLETRARVRWGAGNAFSEALIDYPLGGTIFSVCGAFLEVFIVPSAAAFLAGTGGIPIVGAFAAYGSRGSDTAQVLTQTGATPPAQIVRPAHAIAYRVMPVSVDPNVARNWTRTQLNGAGQLIQTDQDAVSFGPNVLVGGIGAALGDGTLGMVNQGGWIPLLPSCTRIQVLEPAATVFNVQWLIDLG